MSYGEIVKLLAPVVSECEKLADEYGEKALEIVSDYPLYASSSNISYGEAIAIATLVGGDIRKQERTDNLMREYFKTDREHSFEDYNKWLSERSKK